MGGSRRDQQKEREKTASVSTKETQAVQEGSCQYVCRFSEDGGLLRTQLRDRSGRKICHRRFNKWHSLTEGESGEGKETIVEETSV